MPSQVTKLYKHILERKIRPVNEEKLNEEEFGFRPER